MLTGVGRHFDTVESAVLAFDSYLLAYSALCPASRRHSSMNFSTSAGSNLKGLRPGPIFTAGRYGFRLPEACCTTQEMLTPSLLATSAALMSCRIGVTSARGTGKIFACSMPFTRCILASHTLAVPSCLLFTEKAELCQTDARFAVRYYVSVEGTLEQNLGNGPCCRGALGRRTTNLPVRASQLPATSRRFAIR